MPSVNHNPSLCQPSKPPLLYISTLLWSARVTDRGKERLVRAQSVEMRAMHFTIYQLLPFDLLLSLALLRLFIYVRYSWFCCMPGFGTTSVGKFVSNMQVGRPVRSRSLFSHGTFTPPPPPLAHNIFIEKAQKIMYHNLIFKISRNHKPSLGIHN